jgi:DNA polymerase III subunit epsilon
MTSSTGHWTRAAMAALDLEGSGAQDHEDEAILEIAVVPLAAGQPDTAAAYTTFINPGRRIPRRPWISPGLTTAVLAAAPGPAAVEPELARRISGHIIVGHNTASTGASCTAATPRSPRPRSSTPSAWPATSSSAPRTASAP